MTGLGIVTGMVFEAETLRKALAGTEGVAAVRVAASGPGRRRAREKAAELCREGATALLSMGVAGGLDPALVTGDTILAEGVQSEDGRRLPADPTLRQALARLFQEDTRLASGEIVTTHSPATSRAGKRALHARTSAIAVDMESFGIAEAAHTAGVPFLALRVVADTADQEIPLAALAGLRADGQTNPWPVIRAALFEPRLIGELGRLARRNRRAREGLGRLGELLFAAPGLFHG